jgi:molybdopterin converting factor small subunit
MPRVFIPAALRPIAAGLDALDVDGGTVSDVVDQLEGRFPGFRSGVCQGDRLRPGLAVTIDGRIAPLGLRQSVPPGAEIHFLPALGGG